MSDEWDSGLPITKLVLPTNGQEAPLTGTTVFGPLPPALIAALPPQATGGGIIWYSTKSTGYNYWFIAEIENNVSGAPSGNFYYGGVLIGYMSWDGVTVQYSTFSGQQIDLMANSGELLLNASYVLTGDTELTLRSTVQNISTNYKQQFWSSNINTPIVEVDIYATQDGGWITDSKSATIDKWRTATTTGTVNGVANTTLKVDAQITFDRWVDFRFSLPFTSAPTAGIVNISANVPAGIAAGSGSGVNNMAVFGSYTGNTLSQPGVFRLIYQSPTTMQLVLSAVTATATTFTGQACYSITKPVYS
jgi:hypothetical protein